MKITKIGHCCLLIEENNLRILTDPGAYSTGQNNLKNIDAVLITHEHADHLHIESVKAIVANNPKARIITNTAVGLILAKENIAFEIVEEGQNTKISTGTLGVSIEGCGTTHADIYKTITPVQNTGYFIANKLFYPGDALHNPNKQIDVLALPVAGPWLTMAQAIDYALAIKPRVCFPVHEGMVLPDRIGPLYRVPAAVLEKENITFVVMKEGSVEEF